DESNGRALIADDDEMIAARDVLARDGQWQELSGAIGLAALRRAVRNGMEFEGPVVAILTSSGMKDVQNRPEAEMQGSGVDFAEIERQLAQAGI
ncbi:MAG: threonine synthase, partial [Alphaproteobacteria bacterium]